MKIYIYKCSLCGVVAMSQPDTDYENNICGICGRLMTPVPSTAEDALEVLSREWAKILFRQEEAK